MRDWGEGKDLTWKFERTASQQGISQVLRGRETRNEIFLWGANPFEILCRSRVGGLKVRKGKVKEKTGEGKEIRYT